MKRAKGTYSNGQEPTLVAPPMGAAANIDDAAYDYICRLVYERSRIKLGTGKKELVASRIGKRLRALGLTHYKDYCDYLRSPGGDQELVGLIDVISTNVTEFFRESSHFDFMESRVLPAWLRAEGSSGKPFRAWSAACSTGEEPYSIAMVLDAFFRRQSQATWSLEASDISTRVLEHATIGVYRTDRVKLPNPDWLSAYFQKGVGEYAGCCRIKADLRKRIHFHHVNLFQNSYPFSPGLDVIFCRNVMIYFDRATQEELVNRLRQQLKPGGYLMVGHSESLIAIQHQMKCVQPSVYRKE